jgi:hypothetical protein
MTEWEEDCLKWHGKVLDGADAHWCHEFDGLPVDVTCWEYSVCTCGKTKWGRFVHWFTFLFRGIK